MAHEPARPAVIGLGPMGQAMTRSLLTAGHPVTVWNRTPSRAEGVVAAGAVLARSPAEAVAAGGPVILSLTDYRAMDDVLGGAAEALAGRTVVNLSSDTPDRTRAAARWVESHGGAFLAGGVMVPPPMVGTVGSFVYCSGPKEVFAEHAETLAVIGEARYLGEDPGLAQVMYQAHLDVFLTSLSALMHATALVGGAGIPASEFLPEVLPTLTGIPAMLGEEMLEEDDGQGDRPGARTGARIDAGRHPGDLGTATMMGATADHIVGASEAAGIDLALPRAVQAHYRRVLDAGHGSDGWTRILDAVRDPR